jgi:hypothetical protein
MTFQEMHEMILVRRTVPFRDVLALRDAMDQEA